MADAPRAPTVPPLEGWVPVDESTDYPFELGPVSVVARTVIYEDASVRESIPGVADGPWRFLFASRLEIHPRTPPSKALTRLVTRGAKRGFESRLEARGFLNIHPTGTRTMRVGDSVADLTQYEATVSFAGVRLAAAAMFAVRPDGDHFVLVGGAYPRAVLDTPQSSSRANGGRHDSTPEVSTETTTTPVDTATLRSVIDPEKYRTELLRAIRETT